MSQIPLRISLSPVFFSRGISVHPCYRYLLSTRLRDQARGLWSLRVRHGSLTEETLMGIGYTLSG